MNHNDAVVPDAKDAGAQSLSQVPYTSSNVLPSMLPAYGSKPYDAASIPVSSSYRPGPSLPHGGAALVPQLGPQHFPRLTTSQQAELELARRRAQKAAEGKRANATAARRAKRKAQQRAEVGSDKDEDETTTVHPPEAEGQGQTDSDIEAKLATVEDQKEAKRLKRLLRNRVSAQQARERKKSYVQDLEARSKEQDQQIEQAGQRIKVLERENDMLRQVIKNMQGGGGRNGLKHES